MVRMGRTVPPDKAVVAVVAASVLVVVAAVEGAEARKGQGEVEGARALRFCLLRAR